MGANLDTLAEFIDHFKDEEICMKHFESIRFRNGKYCPHCDHDEVYTFAAGRRYRCADCHKDFTIKTGTVFGNSKLPLRKWFIAIYLLSSSKKGISSVQLAAQVGVTQKTAWFMDHRIREAIKQGKQLLSGTVEADETYVGGKEKNKHHDKRTRGVQGRSVKTKTPVMGFFQRGGDVKAEVIDGVSAKVIEGRLVDNVAPGSTVYTDELASYSKLERLFRHEEVHHKVGEYAREGGIHANTIESFWAVFKRGYNGVYHKMSKKHLQRYVDEFCYRFNARTHSISRVFNDATIRIADSDKLTYKMLTG